MDRERPAGMDRVPTENDKLTVSDDPTVTEWVSIIASEDPIWLSAIDRAARQGITIRKIDRGFEAHSTVAGDYTQGDTLESAYNKGAELSAAQLYRVHLANETQRAVEKRWEQWVFGEVE